MSNARSPREVCSTTIGTRGVIFAALLSRRFAVSCLGKPPPQPTLSACAGSPERRLRPAARPLQLRLLRGPKPLPRLRPLDRDRLGGLDDQVEGKPRLQLILQLCKLATVAQPLQVRLPLEAKGLCHLLVAWVDPLRLDDCRQRRLPAECLLGVAGEPLKQLLFRLARHPQIGLPADPAGGKPPLGPLPDFLGARLDVVCGNLDLRPLDNGIERRFAELRLNLSGVRLLDKPVHLLPKLRNGGNADAGGKLVVKLRQPLLPNGLHREDERNLLVAQPPVGVVEPEPHPCPSLLADDGANQRPLQLAEEAAPAKLEQLVPPLVFPQLTVVGVQPVVDDQVVARLGRPLHLLEAGEPPADRLQLLLHLPLLGARLAAADLKPLVLAQLRLWQDANLEAEAQRLPRRRQAGQLDPRVANRLEVGLLKRLRVPQPQPLANHLLKERLPAHPPDHKLGGHPSLPEAGELDPARLRRRDPLQLPFHLGSANDHLPLHLCGRQGFRLHLDHGVLRAVGQPPATIPFGRCKGVPTGSAEPSLRFPPTSSLPSTGCGPASGRARSAT